MTALPPGHTVQDLATTPAGYNPYAQALNDLSGDQVGRSLQQQGQRNMQNATTAERQQLADALALSKKAEVIGMSSSGAPAMAEIARVVMPEAQRTGTPPAEVIADWIGRRR
jgi:precorrin-3B methylase